MVSNAYCFVNHTKDGYVTKIKYAALLGITLLLSACSQTTVVPTVLTEPTCTTCNEEPTHIVNQCAKKVAIINYTDSCGDCQNAYAVTVRKYSCCAAQGCDK